MLNSEVTNLPSAATPIPFFDAMTVNARFDLQAAAERVIRSHWYVLGHEVRAFEEEFAQFCGALYCVSVANGTDALELALRGLEIGYGADVALVSNAGFYGSTAVLQVGAKPNYIDVDPLTQNMDPGHLAKRLEAGGIKAIILTHLYGRLADVEAIEALSRCHGIPLIEDCAQAHGAARGGRRAGSFAQLGCFSFYPTKNLGALGDGGALTTSDVNLANRLRQLRQYGWSQKYHIAIDGGRNSRLDELQAAILRVKLPHLTSMNAQRRETARRYTAAFTDLPVICPEPTGDDYVAHLYVLQMANRDAFREAMRHQEIATDVHYPLPDHCQPTLKSRLQPTTDLKTSELLATQVVSLPCYPGMTDRQITRVIAAVKTFFSP